MEESEMMRRVLGLAKMDKTRNEWIKLTIKVTFVSKKVQEKSLK